LWKQNVEMSGMSAKEEAFMNANNNYYDSSSSDANSGYSTISLYSTGSSACLSLLSTDTTYGTFGSWFGPDTHASGYEADTESMASTK